MFNELSASSSIIMNGTKVKINCEQFEYQDFLLNFTFINFPNEDALLTLSQPYSLWDYVKIFACVITMMGIIFGNAGVIIAVALNKELRNTINYYLTNLAVADILIAALCMWVHLVNDLNKPFYFLGPIICKVNSFIQSKTFFIYSKTFFIYSKTFFIYSKTFFIYSKTFNLFKDF